MAAIGEADAGAAVRRGDAEIARRSPIGALVRNLEAEQEQWFLWLPVMLGAGIALYFLLPVEPSTYLALLPVVAAVALRLGLGRSALAGLATAALLAGAFGFAGAKLRTEAARAPVLERQIGPVEVTGFVELVEPRSPNGQRLTIRVVALEKVEPRDRPYRVRIRTPGETRGEARALQPGDAVRVKATLSPPPGPSLPGDFDFARAAWFQGLGTVGFATAAPERVGDLAEPPLSLGAMAAIARVRQAIGRRIVEALPGQTGAIANALITGERGGISEATNQAFRDSGLFHILSISGLHMVIMAGAVFFTIRLALAAIPAIALSYPIKKWAAGGAMAGALGYLLISGAAFATVRSYIMISIMFLAVLLDRPAMALRNVALAALAILLVWPESLFDPGFQMSFAAVVALVSAYEWLRTRAGEPALPMGRPAIRHALLFLGGIVTSTLVASLAVAPFGVYHFHNTQQFAILANLLAIPICNLIVMPAALAALVALPFGLEAAPLALMGWGIDAMVVRRGRGGAAGRGGARAGDPDLRLRGHGGRRPVVGAVAHAQAVAGAGADRARADASAHGTATRRAGRPRRHAGRRARRRRPALGAGGARVDLRDRALARARRRRPRAGGSSQGAGVPLRRPGLHGAREGPAGGRHARAGGAA